MCGWWCCIFQLPHCRSAFYSFFSSWKDPLIRTARRITQPRHPFHVKQPAIGCAPFCSRHLLVLFWQNVKGEYRQFLNGGQFSQRVVVSQDEASGNFRNSPQRPFLPKTWSLQRSLTPPIEGLATSNILPTLLTKFPPPSLTNKESLSNPTLNSR